MGRWRGTLVAPLSLFLSTHLPKLVWSNGSTDEAGETEGSPSQAGAGEFGTFTASLGEGEHLKKLKLNSSWTSSVMTKLMLMLS